MTREEHIYQLKLYLKGLSKCMVPASTLYWKEHYEEIIEALEQEPFKPMVEIDLYSVIKQKYIEREVLDKVRAEIKKQQYGYMGGTDYEEGVRFGLMLAHQILDKYKAESER